MTDQYDPGAPEGADLTDAQKAFLAQQAAAHAVEGQPSPAADQAATAAAMTDRGPLLPAEQEADGLMAMLKKQAEQIEALTQRVGVMQKQADERAEAEGGAPVIRYAAAAADKMRATAAAHPDLGPSHFARPLALADELVTAAGDLHRDGGDTSAVEKAAGALRRWLDVTHPREGRKHVETFAALRDDIDTAVDEAYKLAA